MADDGIVICAHGKSFIIRSHGRNISCEIRGRVKFKCASITPVAVGDNVLISLNADGTGSIEQVEERRTMFFRAAKGSESKKQVIAANLDQLAVMASVKNPPLKIGLVERFLIAAAIGGLSPVILINKVDLDKPALLEEFKQGYGRIGIPTFFVSCLSDEGLKAVRESLKGHRTILAGHSGVGKTALINRLIPGLNLKEGEVSEYSDRGIHTTSSVELFELPEGGFVADSPGLKVMGLWEVEKSQLAGYFPEMQGFIEQCRFVGCSHTHEPDCAIKQAVGKGVIPRFRYQSYVTILNSL
jgi:ribosome biogenesis GTPase